MKNIIRLLSILIVSMITHQCHAHKTHHLTIFIHGTIIPVPHFPSLYKSLSSNQSDNSYESYLNHLRYEPHYQMQLMGGRGLDRVDIHHYDAKKHRYSATCFDIAQKYHAMHQKNTHRTSQAYSYYLFGWLGKLCADNRHQEGVRLFNCLAQKVASLKALEPDTEVEITLVAHSHGGNVALNIAQAVTQSKPPFKIKNLILLGTPLQQETALNALHSIFERIYTIYSTGDWIQKLDFFSSRDRSAHRSFHQRTKQRASLGTLPNNIYDIEILIDDYKPTHSELWLTAGIPSLFYRTTFPLHPQPVVTLVPLITKIVDTYKKHSTHLKINIKKDDLSSPEVFDKISKKNITPLS